jgi:hypothetical protein
MECIRKRRPLEIEITFKQKIVCSWEQSAMHTVPIQGESKKTDTFDIQMNNKGVSFF